MPFVNLQNVIFDQNRLPLSNTNTHAHYSFALVDTYESLPLLKFRSSGYVLVYEGRGDAGRGLSSLLPTAANSVKL